jgi:hypothetical protein
MLLFVPILLLWGLCETIWVGRTEKEENVPGAPPVAATTPVVAPQKAWMVFFALIDAALIACEWAAKPLAAFLEVHSRGIRSLPFMFGLADALGRGKPFHGLLEPFYFVPL